MVDSIRQTKAHLKQFSLHVNSKEWCLRVRYYKYSSPFILNCKNYLRFFVCKKMTSQVLSSSLGAFLPSAGKELVKLANCNESVTIWLLPWAILSCLSMLRKSLDLNENPHGFICSFRNRNEIFFLVTNHLSQKAE